MKRMLICAALVLSLAAAAQAVTAVYAEITYPTATTWKLWLTECDWTGSLPITPSGLGIAAFAADVTGITSAVKSTPPAVNLFNADDPPVLQGQVGFSVGANNVHVMNGFQCFGGQDLTVFNSWFFGFGVTAGAYTPPAGWSTSGPFQWEAPGAPWSASPGVLAFQGKREAGTQVGISWGERAQANVFTGGWSYMNTPVTQTVPIVPEPATLALLALASLAAIRRRR